MPRLTETQIRNAKPAPKPYKLSADEGLQLWVMPTGKKYWRGAYRFDGKQKLFALGVYPEIGTAKARDDWRNAKAQLKNGIDPGETRKLAKAARIASTENTFEAIFRELLEKKRKEGMAPKTLSKFEWLIGLALPFIGKKPIADLENDAPAILAVLRPVEARGQYETATRLRENIGQVFRYAVATARAKNDPTFALRGALITPKPVHRAAIIEPKPYGKLLAAVDSYEGQPETRIALLLLAITMVRPGELRNAEWREFDLDAATWSIPEKRMKMRRPHRVPLSPQAVALLKQLRPMARKPSALLFPGQRSADRPISENTINAALRRLGYSKEEMSGHGFRSAASSMLNECGLWNPDAIERQLAHMDNDEVRRAYARADFWDERVRMMAWWADRCDELRKGALQ